MKSWLLNYFCSHKSIGGFKVSRNKICWVEISSVTTNIFVELEKVFKVLENSLNFFSCKILMTSTILPSNAVDYGIINSSNNTSKLVKKCIKEHKDVMEKEGLRHVYIRENEDSRSVVFTLKAGHKLDYNYWKKMREIISECGAEFVSSAYEDNPLLKLDKGLIQFI